MWNEYKIVIYTLIFILFRTYVRTYIHFINVSYTTPYTFSIHVNIIKTFYFIHSRIIFTLLI